MQHNVDVLVIGAGQAGLAMGYYLKQKNILFAIVGKEDRIGDVWRNRYDSLVLFTPRWFSSLPGMALMGDQNGYPTKDEIADYLEDYAQKYELPVHLNTEVQRGVTSVKGLYFLGLPWQYRRGSALIGGVGDDAEYLINDILKIK